jgi:dTDP-4-amino-4,6-dideoxygalactose transaminase
MKIPFNKPFLVGNELAYIKDAIERGQLSGNGYYTKKCHEFFEKKYGFNKCLLTTSCTDALEMAAMLAEVKEGDEVIMPSFTFVSTANAFVLRGAKIVFADSEADTPNIDLDKVESLINEKTKAIVIVHYAGIACDMDKAISIANKNNLILIEDAAQAIDSYYKSKPLGSFGHLAAFSFHETKNIISGEGGMLVINDEKLKRRAEIIWEKGTNRAEFFRGEVNKYGWVDMGSSFLPSELTASFLYAQLENLDMIQNKRKEMWQFYYRLLKPLEEKGLIKLPIIPDYATNNAHMFYIICSNAELREKILVELKKNGILAVFHYLSLHKSPYYKEKHGQRELPFSDYYSDCLFRLPLFYELSEEKQRFIVETLYNILSTI